MVLRPTHGLSLCAGGGGLDMGLMLAEPGFHTRCYVEWEEYPRSVIIAAQRAGYFAPAPIWDDLTTFDARPFRGAIDTILAGYPCQPFSQAGQRRGEDDERHLWPDVARVIREIGPTWVFLENVAGHVTLGLETVLRELWDMGWTPAVGLFSAAETGAPHERLRVFIVAYCQSERKREQDNAERSDAWDQPRRSVGGSSLRLHGGTMANASHSGSSCPRIDAQRGGTVGQLSDDSREKMDDASHGVGQLHAGQGPDRHGAVDPRGAVKAMADAGRGRLSGPREGQDQQPGRAETVGSGATVGDATGIGRGKGRSEPEFRGGRDSTSSAGGTMDNTKRDGQSAGRSDHGSDDGNNPCPAGQFGLADASSGSGHEGGASVKGSGDREGREREATGIGGHRPCLFPPGPGDGAAWSAVLTMAPGLAPSVAFGDIARRAQQLVALDEAGQLAQAAAESELRRMVDGMASRSRALRLLGNGVFSLAAGHAWRTLAAAHGLGALDLEAADRGGSRDTDDALLRAAE